MTPQGVWAETIHLRTRYDASIYETDVTKIPNLLEKKGQLYTAQDCWWGLPLDTSAQIRAAKISSHILIFYCIILYNNFIV